MSLLLFFISFEAAEESPFVVLPEVAHTHRSPRRLLAQRIMVGIEKDPTDVVDYEIDWLVLLGEDTILSSAWNIPTGIVGDSATNTASTTTIFVSGGTAGTDYGVVNRITTVDGRTFERTLVIPVRTL